MARNRHRGWVETFEPDQLVVALPDLPAVLQALGALDVSWEGIEQNEDLGMALVSGLKDLPAAVRRLREDDDGFTRQELGHFEAERTRALPHAKPHADLDLLIKGIRARFARQFPGWDVTIGKNYGPSLVKGYPHIAGGGNGDPQAVNDALSPPVCEHDHYQRRGRGVRVGLLDTRIFPAERLTGHYIATTPGDLLGPEELSYTMFDGHCAFVASCILQQAPAAELYVRSVLDEDGDGSAWHAAIAVAEFARLGLDVVNLSFGEFLTDDNSAPMVLEAAVKRLGPETVVVAAAGNNGDPKELTEELVREGVKPNSASYPAALPDVVGVGALGQDGQRAAFTPNPAPWIALLAPGVDIIGSYLRGKVMIQHRDKDGDPIGEPRAEQFNGKARWEGCSFAAGVVTGEIAARTRPGRRSAPQALDQLLNPDPGRPCPRIVPNPDNRTYR